MYPALLQCPHSALPSSWEHFQLTNILLVPWKCVYVCACARAGECARGIVLGVYMCLCVCVCMQAYATTCLWRFKSNFLEFFSSTLLETGSFLFFVILLSIWPAGPWTSGQYFCFHFPSFCRRVGNVDEHHSWIREQTKSKNEQTNVKT